MLGQLLHSINPRRVQSRGPTYIESVTEDNHTRNLLFPDSAALQHPDGQPIPLTSDSFGPQSPGFGFDGIHGEIDLEHSRDVRVIIGQDDAPGSPRTILYDSRQGASRPGSASRTYNGRSNRYAPPNTAVPVTSGHGRRSSLVPESSGPSGHARRSSLVVESTGLKSPAIGAIQRAKTRASSISSMSNIEQMSQRNRLGEADTSIHSTCLDCMFGNLTLGYKGTSNKLHIVPLEPRAVDQNINTFATVDGQGSLPKGEARKRSNLAKSYTPSNPPPDMSSPSPPLPPDSGSKDRRRTVLISRTFSVTPPEDAESSDVSGVNTPTPQSSAVKGNAFPFPRLSGFEATSLGAGQRRSRPTKLPMYGITIVMQLPVASQRPPSRGGPRDGAPLAGSFPSHKSFGSSFDSDKRGGWSFIDSSFGVDSLLSASQSSDVDDRVDTLGQHWDVIIRTLTSLQFAIQDRLLVQLKSRDLRATPIPQPPAAARRSKEPIVQPQTRISAKLLPYALMSDVEVQKAVDVAAERLVRGMKIPRVLTGQNRWGVWREEARWLGRWSGGKEENLFFFNILSAFLGHHTEWLNTLGPKKHRRLHRKQQRTNAGEDLTINNRTVIITPDKMAARRLIFLLSAFLPASVQAMNEGSSPIRPGTSASGRGYSQSPPSHVAPSRQQSLRRTINRRGRPSQHHMRLATNGKSLTQQSSESTENAIESPAFDSDDFKIHARRDSETRSTHTTLAIPAMLDAPSTTSKSSATTTSTVTPSSPMPVAHFAMQRTPSFAAAADARPTTGDSLASANLISTLRGGSGHVSNPSTDSQSTGRWSGFMSFWSSGRRDSSTSPSDVLHTTDEGLGISGAGYRRPGIVSSPNKLEQMVRELELNPPPPQYSQTTPESSEDAATDPEPSSSGVPCSGARDIPARAKSDLTPLKLSVNERDGIIDVDIPLPGFGSPLMSPTMPEFHHHSCNADSASFGCHSTRSFSQGEHDQPVNVAGWLGKFHADFELQGVNPYSGIEDDIRKAMLAEPTPMTAATTPNLESGPTDRWVDVCSALVADAGAFTVKKIRLRRLVRLVPIPSQPAITPGRVVGLPTRSAYFDPYQVQGGQLAPGVPMTETHLDWQFTEEIIMDIDETLTDAVERILAQSGQPSRVQSEASSRSSSRRGRLDGRADSDFPGPPVLEIPRAECKQLVLGALEQVVKDVQAERGDAAATHTSRRSRSADSTLREGIRRWLTEVE